ncbi:hypothetical protein D3C76_1398470 [compost metagenome]
MDGGGNDRRGVVGEHHFQALGQVGLEVGNGLAHGLDGFQQVGAGRQAQCDGSSRFAVVGAGDGEVLRAQADLRHVFHAHLRTVRVDLQQDLPELLGGLHP